MIEILSTGAANSVQDLGRFGYLDAGVGRSGAMDGLALEIGNRMLGNPLEAAGVEVTLFPFRLRFDSATAFAVTGADCPVRLNDRPLPPWWAMRAAAGDVQQLGLPRSGARAMICIAGGIDVPPVLGSRATDLKSGWGGFEGRGLQRGDRLALGRSTGSGLADLPTGFGIDPTEMRGPATETGLAGETTVRVLPSAEFADFTDEARNALFASAWQLTNDANRQGFRLQGPHLALSKKLELFSHGIMPGTVQVPPSGQPIIQLAEANTCGGYPKIANVIEADLWRLAQVPVGRAIRFVAIDRPAAIAALRRQRAMIDDIAALAALARKDVKHPERSGTAE